MKLLYATALICIVFWLNFPALAQNTDPPRELIPGFGFCTEEDEQLLDRASSEYAAIMFPKKYDTKHRKKVEQYEKKMAGKGILQRLYITYIKCERRQDEYFPPQEQQEQLNRQYMQDIKKK